MKFLLREVMEEKCISIRELAARSEVSASQIKRIMDNETGGSIQTLCKLAKVLEVPVTNLFSCED